MKYTLAIFSLIALLFSSLAFSGEQLLAISGDGPFSASISTVENAGKTFLALNVHYREREKSSVDICAKTDFYFVFVFGPANDRKAIKVPTVEYCPNIWGDVNQVTAGASWRITSDQNPDLWEALFPVRADGSRWYALEVAALEERSSDTLQKWDSLFGNNYHLILSAK